MLLQIGIYMYVCKKHIASQIMGKMTQQKKKEHIGLSPYALVFRGEKKTEKVQVKAFDYTGETLNELDIAEPKDLQQLNTNVTTTWINVYGVDNAKLMTAIAETYNINPLLLSEVMNPDALPKCRETQNATLFNIKLMESSHSKQIAENISFIITENTLFTFQEKQANFFNPVRERIRAVKSKIRQSGTDYLAFALLDMVIDNYIYHLGTLGTRIEEIEDEFTAHPKDELPKKISDLRRELNHIRKMILPARDMMYTLLKTDNNLLKDENQIHYKELIDNTNEAISITDHYREHLYDLLNMYHTTLSSHLNEIMRVLTIITVVFIPITFIAGIYGTNFEYMPELKWKYGYAAMWAVILLIVLGMIWYFKRKKWFW